MIDCAYSTNFTIISDFRHSSTKLLGAIKRRKITPSTFSLRVGNSCVLVTVHSKDPVKIVGIDSSFLSIGIVKTPELFCSLIGTISYHLFLFVVRWLSCVFGGTVHPLRRLVRYCKCNLKAQHNQLTHGRKSFRLLGRSKISI